MTPFRKHLEAWKDGCGHAQCAMAKTIVHVRGTGIPCDVLFVGEGPGESEDAQGEPFIGPAGQLLDTIIRRSGLEASGLKYAMCNLVGCMPRDCEGYKSGEPEDDQVLACKPRLEELIGIARPRLVVCCGKLPAQWLERGIKNNVVFDTHDPRNVKKIDVQHPAFIIRQNVAMQGLLIQRCVVAISNAIEDL